MQLIIESADEQVLQAISEFARPLNVFIRQIKDTAIVSQNERRRRRAVIQKFKGGLKTASLDHPFSKHEWYNQF